VPRDDKNARKMHPRSQTLPSGASRRVVPCRAHPRGATRHPRLELVRTPRAGRSCPAIANVLPLGVDGDGGKVHVVIRAFGVSVFQIFIIFRQLVVIVVAFPIAASEIEWFLRSAGLFDVYDAKISSTLRPVGRFQQDLVSMAEAEVVEAKRIRDAEALSAVHRAELRRTLRLSRLGGHHGGII